MNLRYIKKLKRSWIQRQFDRLIRCAASAICAVLLILDLHDQATVLMQSTEAYFENRLKLTQQAHEQLLNDFLASLADPETRQGWIELLRQSGEAEAEQLIASFEHCMEYGGYIAANQILHRICAASPVRVPLSQS